MEVSKLGTGPDQECRRLAHMVGIQDPGLM